jgi:hypothetical protein
MWGSAFAYTTGESRGTLTDATGAAIKEADLWALTPGLGGAAGNASTLYFDAGLANEAHGLFGSITVNTVVNTEKPDVDGISHLTESSLQVAALLGSGTTPVFGPGVQALKLVDGTLSTGTDTSEAAIVRLYEGLLGRPGDLSGLSFWDGRASTGASHGAIANGIVTSAEYQGDHGAQTDAQFLTTAYQSLLGRSVETSALSFWTGLLQGGTSRGDVAAGISDSQEGKLHLAPITGRVWVPSVAGTLAHEAYETGLGREVDPSGLGTVTANLNNGLSPMQIIQQIADSAEFRSVHGAESDAAFVTDLYQAGLGRAPETAGSTLYLGLLGSGAATRADVFRDIATSGEASVHLTRNLTS